MTDSRPWIKFDVGYFSNPKILDMVYNHPKAVLLHINCMTYAYKHNTDGEAHLAFCRQMVGADQSDVDALLEAGLLHDQGRGRVLVHDYLKHQDSAEDADEPLQIGGEAPWLG